MVLILEPEIIEVNNTSNKGTILINNKKTNFLSLILSLNLIFFIKIKHKTKNGIKIPICFKINNIGFFK